MSIALNSFRTAFIKIILTEEHMNKWEQFKEALKKIFNFSAEQETQIKEAFEETEKSDKKNDLTELIETFKAQSKGKENDAVTKLLDGLGSQLAVALEANKNLASLLAEEKTNREKSVVAQQTADKAARDKKITDTLDKHEKEGKFPKADRAKWEKRLNENFEEWNGELEAKPVSKEFQNQKQQSSQQQQSASGGSEKKENPREVLRNEIASQMNLKTTV